MTDEQILEVIQEIFVKEFECAKEDVKHEANLYEELGLDSLDSVDLIVALENKFKFKVNRVKDESVLKEIRTIRQVIDYIKVKERELVKK
jgi:acyl carrier protein